MILNMRARIYATPPLSAQSLGAMRTALSSWRISVLRNRLASAPSDPRQMWFLLRLSLLLEYVGGGDSSEPV